MRETMTDAQLEAQLEQLLGRLDPFSVVVRACHLTNRAHANRRLIGRAVPHFLAKMVGVSHAYHRKYYASFMDDNTYRKAHNLLADHTDEIQHYALSTERDIHHWGQVAHRQQIELQYRVDGLELARLASLCACDQHNGGTVGSLFEETIGVSLEFVVAYSVLLYTNLFGESGVGFRRDRGTVKHGGTITQTQVDNYLKHFAWQPDLLGAEYRRRRDAIVRDYLKSLMRTPLLDRAIVSSADGTMLSTPFPDLIVKNALESVFSVIRDNAPAHHQLSDSLFASHIHRLLNCFKQRWPVIVRDLDSEALPAEGKRCDFVVQFPDYDLYIECKTTGSMPRFPFAKPLRESGIATALIEATEQLANSPRMLDREHRSRRSLIIGWNEVPFANSEWFRTNSIDTAPISKQWYQDCGGRPEVLSVRELELFVARSCASGTDPRLLINEKYSQEYSTTGDWGVWLESQGAVKDAHQMEFFSRGGEDVLRAASTLAGAGNEER